MSSSRALPPLKSLLAFRHSAQTLSFKKAAEHLFVTQAAISQQIKSLEQTLGVELFERRTRQVSLTAEGQYLSDYVEKAFLLLEEGVKGITEDPNPNTLVISSLPSFSSRWLVSRLGGFQAQVPDINLRLNLDSGLSTFSDSDLDLCIRLGRGQYEGLMSKPLFEEHLVLVCHPSLINMDEPIKAQIGNIPVITDTGPDVKHVWPVLQHFLEMYDLPMRSHLHTTDSTTLIEALLSRQGLAMARYGLVYDQIEKGQLICPIPIYMKSQYDFYLVAPAPHFKYQKVQNFQHWLETEVKAIKQSWKLYLRNHPEMKEVKVSN